MAREFTRNERLGPQLQRELAELVGSVLDDPRLGMITIQEVRVARDLSHAKVYFTVLGGDADERETARTLNEAAGFLRHELGRRVRMRTLPVLKFIYDESVEHGMRLSALIEQAVDSDHSSDDSDPQ